jgi:hypothetical protein
MHSIFLPQPSRTASRSSIFHPQSSSLFPSAPQPRITPIPRSNWPLWTRTLEKFRHPEDRGLGDTLVHLIGDARSERFKKWFTRKFGKTCGCTERQRWLNHKFPYAD